ncbi:MAG: hypothetical protein WD069_02410 [Planctomycetales bacterium]
MKNPPGPHASSQSRVQGPARQAGSTAVAATLTLAMAFALAGCADEPPVTSYTVPKQPPPELEQRSQPRPADRPRTAPPERGDAPRIEYDVPEGWQAARGDGISIAAFEVADGNQAARITVSSVMGSVAANINRWRGQVGLPSQSGEEIAKGAEKVPVGDTNGVYVELFGPERDGKQPAILGIVAQAAGRQWFFKLTGDGELARREKDRFLQFAKSVRFEESESDGDGN